MKSDKTLKKALLQYGVTEEEADGFLEYLAKMPEELEEDVKESVVEKDFNDPKEADKDRIEKDFN